MLSRSNIVNTTLVGMHTICSLAKSPEEVDAYFEEAQDDKYFYYKTGCTVTDSCFETIPQNIGDYFPHLTHLHMENCGLKVIKMADLGNLINLIELKLCRNKLKVIPGDLFQNHEKLQKISFAFNKITHIQPGFVSSCYDIEEIDLRGNYNFDKLYKFDGEDLGMKEFVNDCNLRTVHQSCDKLKFKPVSRKKETCRNCVRRDSQKILLNQVDEVNNNNSAANEVKADESFGTNNFMINFKQLKSLEAFKDFKIRLENGEMSFHRFVLAAYSSVLSDMFVATPDATVLELLDYNLESFSAIHDYIYEGKFPENQSNMLDTFAISNKLDIKPTMNFAEKKLLEEVNNENAYEVFCVASKCKSQNLMEKTFKILQDKVPEKKFLESWKNHPAKIKKVIDAKEKLEDTISKAKLEFESLNISDDENVEEDQPEIRVDSEAAEKSDDSLASASGASGYVVVENPFESLFPRKDD